MRGQRFVSLGAVSTAAISLLSVCAAQAAAPVVSNVRAAQRSGTQVEDITYDLADADSSALTVSVAVNKATPSITTPPTASAITYGQALSASTLSGGAASVPGGFQGRKQPGDTGPDHQEIAGDAFVAVRGCVIHGISCRRRDCPGG